MSRVFSLLSMAILVVWLSTNALADDAKKSTDKPVADAGKAKASDQEKGPYRKLAPYVFTKIPQETDESETMSRHDVVELLATDSKYDWAKNITFRHKVWQLEFEFKPMRMIYVDIPQTSGMMQRKLVWYMVYTVKNTGEVFAPKQEEALPYENILNEKQKVYTVTKETKPVDFIPEFVFEGSNRMKDGEGFAKSYPDRVIPVAIGPIQTREDPKRKLLNTVEMCEEAIPVGETRWGVATWEDIDPRIVRFSVYVSGLTNAYIWKDTPGAYKAGDPIGKGRQMLSKTLKLNFWRPGDEYFEHEEEIRYGIPGQSDYEWVYR
jgi:hypothetical protein